MWKLECYVVCFALVAATLVSAVAEQRECDSKSLDSCPANERCKFDPELNKYFCTCKIGYILRANKCIQEPTTVSPRPETTTEKLDDKSGSSGGSVAVGLLVPTFLILLGVMGFCAARRYRLLPCRRNLYGNVLVTRDDDDDDDDDDPPIA